MRKNTTLTLVAFITFSLITSTVQSQWTQKGIDIDGEAAEDRFGQSLSISSDGNTVAIGASQNDGNGENAGHVRIYEFLGVGILENDFGNELSIYPNPTSGNFSIELGANFELTTITLMDINGKTIRVNEHNRSELLSLSIGEPTGVYLLMVESGAKKAVIRIVQE